MTIAIAAALAIMVAAGLVYVFLVSKETSAKFNGAAIVAAARAYTHDLRDRKEPIPKSVTLQELVERHFLKPEEIAAFRGLNATVMLTSTQSGPQFVLMRVHLPEGGDIILLGDGSVQQVPR
jgi:hypothetical protein